MSDFKKHAPDRQRRMHTTIPAHRWEDLRDDDIAPRGMSDVIVVKNVRVGVGVSHAR